MWKQSSYDAVIVGSGPNGLSAAIHLSRQGLSVLVLEARETIGGGMRSSELTLPGFTHDMCAAILPLSLNSPFFKTLPLADYGVEWVHPPVQLAHPLDNGRAGIVRRSLEETARSLGEDEDAYHRLYGPLIKNWDLIQKDILGPLPFPPHHPIASARFGILAIRTAISLARTRFQGETARAIFAGMAGHSIMPLEWPATAAFGLVTNLAAHTVGWPLVRGGTQNLANALAGYFISLGGEICTGTRVTSIYDLPAARAVFFDTSPTDMVRIAGDRLPPSYKRQIKRYRYGAGVFKMDFALDDPIPWSNPECRQSATLHLGGTLEEIAAAERAVGKKDHPQRPFVLVAQPSLFDPSRAPKGKHTVWAYCHVPNGSTVDMSNAIESQIERFAPGFRDRILARVTHTAVQMEAYNPNYVGGDINTGVQDLRQLFTRPVVSMNPYATPDKGIFLCSSATPPGGGVHGLSGFYAAQAALKSVFRS